MFDGSSLSTASGPMVVFFDGVCNLCNGVIDQLIRIDRRSRLRYASLQGETARAAGLTLSANAADKASIVVIDGQVRYTESDAVLQIMARLGGAWRILSGLRILPKVWRDSAYHLVARNRYRLFGVRSSCRLPSEAERHLFLP